MSLLGAIRSQSTNRFPKLGCPGEGVCIIALPEMVAGNNGPPDNFVSGKFIRGTEKVIDIAGRGCDFNVRTIACLALVLRIRVTAGLYSCTIPSMLDVLMVPFK